MIRVELEPHEARALCRAVELLALVFEHDERPDGEPPRPLEVAAMKLSVALVSEREVL